MFANSAIVVFGALRLNKELEGKTIQAVNSKSADQTVVMRRLI